MAAYRDNKGKDWQIAFSDAAQVRDLMSLDLTDHGALLRAAQILCQDEIAARGMPTRQFIYRTIRFDPTGLLWAIRKAADEWQVKETQDTCPAEPDLIIDLEPLEK